MIEINAKDIEMNKEKRSKKEGKSLKVCFAASSGGHYEQLMMLRPLMDKYNSFVLTEKTSYKAETSVLYH